MLRRDRNQADDGTISGYSLAGGAAGIGVFLHYLGEYVGDIRYRDAANVLIESAAEAIANEPREFSLSRGFPGVGWAIAHLANAGFINSGDYDVSELDNSILEFVESKGALDFDLLAGCCGLGVYALERARGTNDSTLVDAIVCRLLRDAKHDDEGMRWFTHPQFLNSRTRELYPRGYYSLGLSHGTPGVIALLGRACLDGWRSDLAEDAIAESVRWLQSQRYDDASRYGSAFPSIRDESSPMKSSRLAWCYGDLSIAVAIAAAAAALDRESLLDEARQLAEGAAVRTEDAGVVDPAFCHGASGVAHLFSRINLSVKSDHCAAAATRWYQRALAFRGDNGVAGFKYFARDRGEWVSNVGLLEGVAGIGLVFISAVSNQAPGWDRAFLIDADCREQPVVARM